VAIYPGAQWHGPVPNQGGAMGNVRLGVVHIESGSQAGTDAWFHNPNAQVSAHFGIAKDGTVYQWVDTSRIAWAEAAYNDCAISVENEGYSGEQLTFAQAVALSKLMVWVYQTHGVPLARNSDPNGVGWIGHGELGVAGGAHPLCPGQPILDQLPTVIKAAWEILFPPQPTPNPPSHRTLTPGMSGLDVCWVQQYLKIKVTGVFDDATSKAVIAFRTKNGLPGKAIVGPRVWKLMGQ
jgi:N-acetylmuramoyl-L-alanine amidase/Putative peptidoglycan binding domain